MDSEPADLEYAVVGRKWDVNESEVEALLNRYAAEGYRLEETVRGGDRKTLFVFRRPSG